MLSFVIRILRSTNPIFSICCSTSSTGPRLWLGWDLLPAYPARTFELRGNSLRHFHDSTFFIHSGSHSFSAICYNPGCYET